MAGGLDRYRSEATGEPFVLLDERDGTVVEISRPPVVDVLHAPPGRLGLVHAVAGDQLDELLAMVGGDDYRVLLAVIDDALAHFGYTGVERLAWLLDRYGDHIEADLRPGVDMLDLWRGRLSPRTLLNLIDHLPRTSHLQQAMAQDDELAEGLELPDGQPSAPPLTEFTPEVEVLNEVADRLWELINTTVAANGGKPRAVKPRPRPVTALDRRRAASRRAAQDDLAARLFPGRRLDG